MVPHTARLGHSLHLERDCNGSASRYGIPWSCSTCTACRSRCDRSLPSRTRLGYPVQRQGLRHSYSVRGTWNLQASRVAVCILPIGLFRFVPRGLARQLGLLRLGRQRLHDIFAD